MYVMSMGIFLLSEHRHIRVCVHSACITKDSNKTVFGLSFWFLFRNLTPLQTCPHANIPYQQTTQVWVQPHERQIPSLEILFQVTIPLKWFVGYREISEKHFWFCGGLVNSSTKYFNFKCRFGRVICSHTQESPHWR